jgi:hypothetical protein
MISARKSVGDGAHENGDRGTKMEARTETMRFVMCSYRGPGYHLFVAAKT